MFLPRVCTSSLSVATCPWGMQETIIGRKYRRKILRREMVLFCDYVQLRAFLGYVVADVTESVHGSNCSLMHH